MGVGHRSTTLFFFLTARRLLLRRDSPSTGRKNNNAQSYLPVTEALPLAAKSVINAGTSKYQHVLFPGQLHKRGFCKDHQQGGCSTFLRKNLLMFAQVIFFHWKKNTHYICTLFLICECSYCLLTGCLQYAYGKRGNEGLGVLQALLMRLSAASAAASRFISPAASAADAPVMAPDGSVSRSQGHLLVSQSNLVTWGLRNNFTTARRITYFHARKDAVSTAQSCWLKFPKISLLISNKNDVKLSRMSFVFQAFVNKYEHLEPMLVPNNWGSY